MIIEYEGRKVESPCFCVGKMKARKTWVQKQRTMKNLGSEDRPEKDLEVLRKKRSRKKNEMAKLRGNPIQVPAVGVARVIAINTRFISTEHKNEA